MRCNSGVDPLSRRASCTITSRRVAVAGYLSLIGQRQVDSAGCCRQITTQDFPQSDLEADFMDEQTVELGKCGTEGLPSKRAQLVFSVSPTGVTSIEGGQHF